jgi:uncharacterized protein
MSDTQLIEAVKAENIVSVRELIDSGSDVNQQDEQGWTPLNWASGRGNLEIVKLLVEKGADVFKVGRDLRSPYLIALAAGHAEVVKFLRQAEDQVPGEKPTRPERKYCKAYHLRDLRRFSGWAENRINWKAKKEYDAAKDSDNGETVFTDDSIVFVHQDHTVTESMWQNENVIFNDVTDDWRAFCAGDLSFRVPDDIDLIVAAKSGE